jgi:hypothetical protein
MATYDLVVDFMVRLEEDLSSGGGVALPTILKASLKALRKLVVGTSTSPELAVSTHLTF